MTYGIGNHSDNGMRQPKRGTGLTPNAYHHGRKVKRDRSTNQEQRQFIAWDGEGVNLRGPGKPQSYILFGSSVGHIEGKDGLSVFDCLDHIIETGVAHPKAIHCGFAFSYDANMIIQSLSPVTLARLHRNGWTRLKKANGDRYSITFAKGKYFRVTKYKPEYDAKHNSTAKTTVQIFDIWSFFATSFIKAYENMVGEIPDVIRSGKAARGQLTIEDFQEIKDYWSVEIQYLRLLAEELRRRVYNAGLRITQWHGPGALASHAMRERGIKTHMAETSEKIREASRYAYAGGRFELFKVGRVNGPVYGIDINSAYPEAIAQLPSLSEGEWHHVDNPTRVSRFGVYRVRLKKFGGFVSSPSPLFHRDKNHNISYPWTTEGWYWSPEAYAALRCGAEIVEGWEYRGARTKPFAYIQEMYDQRRDWKRRGISAQVALKLCMNSTYGKLAQRIGWDPVNRRLPPWHQLEWAGWVTSYTRAKLFDVIARIPYDQLIAVETDGIYTTMKPDKLGIVHSEELGGWEISEYQEVMYVQSGLAWLQDLDGTWHEKRRGLDGCRNGHLPNDCDCLDVFSLGACRNFLSTLHPNPDRLNQWQPYVGATTRFIGMGMALMSSLPTESRHCVWETNSREILPGIGGKRVHMRGSCDACQRGSNAFEAAHDLVIHSLAVLDPMSYPHTIPWENEVGHAQWRDYADMTDDELSEIGV